MFFLVFLWECRVMSEPIKIFLTNLFPEC
uniref:Uncharacterized protein n=1 Tax=Anguilla anguilla TaxID=7936 RepID=A0A0E9RGB3_ANGAN